MNSQTKKKIESELFDNLIELSLIVPCHIHFSIIQKHFTSLAQLLCYIKLMALIGNNS